MKEDGYIGTEIQTKYGNTLKVVGVSHVQNNGVKVYQVTCDKCIEDKELYPDVFTSTKGNLDRGKCPCGCYPRHRHSEEGCELLAKRYCDKHNLSYLGAVDKIINFKSRFKYKCSVCHTEHSIPIQKIITYKGCKECINKENAEKLIKSEEDSIKDFTNHPELPNYYTYKKINRTEWNVKCSVCSTDMFSNNGLCNGVFKTTASNLLKGIKPCRCSPYWRIRDLSFVKLIAESILPTRKLSYGEFKGIYTRVTWFCEYGHKNSYTLHYLLNFRKTECSTCNNVNWRGLYRTRLSEKDTLYLIKLKRDDECFVKIGRSFQPKVRFQTYNNEGFHVEIIDLKYGVHLEVWEQEQLFLLDNIMYKYRPSFSFGGETECFTLESEDIIKERFTKCLVG